MKKKISVLGLGLLLIALLFTSCRPATTPQVIESTPRTVEVTRIVAGTPETIIITVEPEMPTPEPVDPERARTLILGFEGGQVASPDIANPFIPARWPMISAGLHQAVFESLFYLNYETGEIQPWQAESYSFNDDYTELAIKIRPGVEWSDGQPFTARDVAFTINMLKDNPTLINGPAMEQWVEAAEVVDDSTVRITLTAPHPRFVLDFLSVQVWGSIIVMPEHIWKDQDPTTFKNLDLEKGWPVATGPYRLTQASSTEFSYERRDDWWAAKTGFHALPAPEKLIFIEQGTEDRRAAMLSENQVDGLPALGLGAYRVAQARNPNVIAWLPEPPYAWIDPCPFYFEFNTTVQPWDDPEMRWAVSYAIDKEKLADLTNEGSGLTAQFLFPTYGALSSLLEKNQALFEQYPVMEYNPEKAIEIIESKGYTRGAGGFFVGPDGQPLTLEIMGQTPSEGGVAWGISASLFTEYLAAVGIQVTPKLLSVSAYQDAASLGDFEARQAWLCGSVTDPYTTLNAFHANRAVPVGERTDYDKGAGRWVNEEYSAIVDQVAQLEPGDPHIDELFTQALEIFLRELPAFGLYQQVRIVPYTSTYWTNWPTSQNNYIHPPNWWMTTHQFLIELQPASQTASR